MHDIRFRVWDKTQKVMLHYDKDIVPLMTLNGVLVDAGITGHSTNVSYRFIVEQYTGLKDKNGKEIYEGDILQGVHGKYPVFWDTKTASFKARIVGFANMRAENWKQREIIGTIHDTPEGKE